MAVGRQIVLDTETTGLRVEDGHRIIEIGCIEMVNRKLTGVTFHQYINPGREVDAGAMAVHGITNEFLMDKPSFRDISADFVAFIDGAELIIHNAPFDMGFLSHELLIARQGYKKMTDYCTVLDTLPLARKMHVGQRNNLDALCKRYFVDNTKREYHGALMDAHLLAQVYLAMTGGQGNFFDLMHEERKESKQNLQDAESMLAQKLSLNIIYADENENTEHQKYLDLLQKKGACLWRMEEETNS